MSARTSPMFDALLVSLAVSILPAQDWTYFKASAPDANDFFGYRVAMSGDTLVVGAQAESSSATGVDGDRSDDGAAGSGAAYVFVRSGTTWAQQAYLKASNTDVFDRFGYAVAISGDTVVVGAPNEDSAATGVDGDQSDDSAASAGAVYVFVRSGSVWSQQAYLKASNTDASDRFGQVVAIDGDTLVVGAPFERSAATGVNGDESDDSASLAGAAYVFVRNGTTWSQQAYLKPALNGGDLQFGAAVAIHGDEIAIGAPFEDGDSSGVDGDPTSVFTSDSGAIYLFERNAGTWSQTHYVKASNPDVEDIFGQSVAFDGSTLVVGAEWEDSAATGIDGDQVDDTAVDSGAAYVFERSGSTWVQTAYLKASNTDADDLFGFTCAVAGDLVAIGAPAEDGPSMGLDGFQGSNSSTRSGAVYLFERRASGWEQLHYVKATNTNIEDGFGRTVALDLDRLLAGATGEASAASGVDGDQSDNSAWFAGAAYLLDLDRWNVVHGCAPHTASLVPPDVGARIGSTVDVGIDAGLVVDGVAATYYGSKGVDVSGCGTPLTPVDELLLALAPFPVLHSFSSVVGGAGTVSLALPGAPGLAGIHVTLQSAIVDTATFATELTSGLEFRILP